MFSYFLMIDKVLLPTISEINDIYYWICVVYIVTRNNTNFAY